MAGIVDLDVIQQFVKEYEYDVKRYALEEDLFWKEDELRGKKRKHDILQERVDKAQAALDEARRAWARKKEDVKELEVKLEEARSAFDEYDAKYRAIDADRSRIEDELTDLREGNEG